MILHPDDDRSSPLEAPARAGARRRRPRYGIESQQPRCPICNKIMVVYMSRRGPKFHCGCDEPNGTNGNGHA
jgi:hypothetical protein